MKTQFTKPFQIIQILLLHNLKLFLGEQGLIQYLIYHVFYCLVVRILIILLLQDVTYLGYDICHLVGVSSSMPVNAGSTQFSLFGKRPTLMITTGRHIFRKLEIQ